MRLIIESVKKIICILLIFFICDVSNAQVDKSFLEPPNLIKNPGSVDKYATENRQFTGISSLAITPEGRMWAVWYAGLTPGEDLNNYVVVATSDDEGETWQEVLTIDPDEGGPVRAFDPEIWIDPDGKLWVFWAQQIRDLRRSTSNGVWAITTSNPEEENPEWSDPRRLVDGVMMCKPIVLSTGEWVLPVSYWHVWEESAKMVVSEDRGQSWHVRGAVTVPKEFRNHDEHIIVERKDGSLWMLVRTLYGIGESISSDRGHTWSPLVPSKIQHPHARFFITRLNSGNLLLVKHGPIDIKTAKASAGRSHLTAFISEDDGHSWSDGLLLDQRLGISYPDGQQASDGTIYITYDYNRRSDQEILLTSFSEEDIKVGSDNKIFEVYKRRKIISKGGTDD